MIDKIGPAITAISGVFILGGQLIDEVNTSAETVAVILFAVGVLVGALRALRASLRFAAKANGVVTMLETLDERLQHGDARMQRIEERLDEIAPPSAGRTAA